MLFPMTSRHTMSLYRRMQPLHRDERQRVPERASIARIDREYAKRRGQIEPPIGRHHRGDACQSDGMQPAKMQRIADKRPPAARLRCLLAAPNRLPREKERVEPRRAAPAPEVLPRRCAHSAQANPAFGARTDGGVHPLPAHSSRRSVRQRDRPAPSATRLRRCLCGSRAGCDAAT